MFHCGGTAVVYNVTGHDEYICHGENGLVVSLDDEVQVIAALKALKNEPGLLKKLQAGARQTAQNWPDWDITAAEFCRVIELCHQNDSDISKLFLQENSEFMLTVRDNGLSSKELSRLKSREQLGGDSSQTFRNHIQVYWDCGRGMEAVLTAPYQSGTWTWCRVVVPCNSQSLKVLRIDPSVCMGIVEIRTIRLSGQASGVVYVNWREGGGWDDIAVTGTACVLSKDPYLLLEAYGEDPQLFLPSLPNLPEGEQLTIEIEVRERTFAQAFVTCSAKVRWGKWNLYVKARHLGLSLLRKVW
jgi:hypothetical protein